MGDAPAVLQPNPWFAGDGRQGASLRFDLDPGPATLVGFTVDAHAPGGARFVAAEGQVLDEPTPHNPTVGGLFAFAGDDGHAAWQRWIAAGVNHHDALARGHVGALVTQVATHLGIDAVQASTSDRVH